AQVVEGSAVVGGDDEGGGEQEEAPEGHERAAQGAGQGGQGGVQALAVEGDVAFLVGEDAGGHLPGEGVGGAVAQGAVVPQGDDFRDHQDQQFRAQAHQAPQPDEDRVAPVARQGRPAARGQQPGQAARRPGYGGGPGGGGGSPRRRRGGGRPVCSRGRRPRPPW